MCSTAALNTQSGWIALRLAPCHSKLINSQGAFLTIYLYFLYLFLFEAECRKTLRLNTEYLMENNKQDTQQVNAV